MGRRSRLPSVAAIGVILIGVLVAATAAASGSQRSTAARQSPALPGGGQLPGRGTLVIGSMRMMSTTVGWAFGGQAGQRAVLRTTDGGTDWTDVTPNISMRHSFALFHFINPDHAWLGLPGIAGGQRDLTVYRTQDAGKTWTKGESILLPNGFPDATPLDPGLQFVDLEHGWLTLGFQGSEPTSTGVGIYATIDGGQRWRPVSVTVNLPGISSPNGLPLGCGKTGIVFNSPATGWATAHCADGSLFLYVTHDGGHS